MTRLLRVVTVFAGLLCAAGAAGAEEYRMMTGPQGGAWYPLGGTLANVVRDAVPGLSVRILPGGGIANVLGVEKGRSQISLGNANSTADAVAGRPPFGEKAQHVRHVATFYEQVFQIIVAAGSGIDSVADLAGRNVAVGLRGHTGEQIARQILEINGLTYDDLRSVNHVNYSDTVSLMKDGHIDAFMIITTIPSSAVMDVATSRDVKLLSIPDDRFEAMRETYNPNYVRRTIPAGTYSGQTEPVATLGTWTHLLAHASVPDDVVYAMLKAIDARRDEFGSVVRAMAGVTPETFVIDVGVPYHPGAEQFYRELGLMP